MLYDKDIREPLFELLEEKYGKSRIFEEKIIGGARADAVMITEDAIYGIEIKSDADTYARLSRQVKYYDYYYDYNYVVVGSSHGTRILGNYNCRRNSRWLRFLFLKRTTD